MSSWKDIRRGDNKMTCSLSCPHSRHTVHNLDQELIQTCRERRMCMHSYFGGDARVRRHSEEFVPAAHAMGRSLSRHWNLAAGM